MKTRMKNEASRSILRCVESLLDISEVAENVTFTITLDKGAFPTLSYKIDNCPIYPCSTRIDEDFLDRFKEKFREIKEDKDEQKEN